MAGIYVHIPFCRRKCNYCNFFSVASGKNRDDFTEILKKEIILQKDYLGGETIETIYFGGGTPSLLEVSEIREILKEIYTHHQANSVTEVTLEANPDDITPEKLRQWKDSGINRLSIGIQSFFDDDLAYLNRIHTAEKAEHCVREAQQAGFSNISIDLIYGIPGLTNEKWERNLEKAIALDVPHLSAYALTVEEGTALEVLIRKKKSPPVSDEQAAEQFMLMQKMMKDAGFLHYEISNFCRSTMFSRHNSNYWNGKKYLGLGPSAHSYDGSSRQWNISGISEYVSRITRNEAFFEREVLSNEDRYNEFVMVSLRTMWGCDISKIRDRFGAEMADHFMTGCGKYLLMGWMVEKEGVYFLTDEGKFFADGIAADLFY